MAIVTFGATARANDSIALKNTSSTAILFALFRNKAIAPGQYGYMTFANFDSKLRGNNLENSTLFSINSNNTPYLDDVAEFAKLLRTGILQAYTASSIGSGGFTLGAALANTVLGDGSVTFS